jgi:hypothetical protein
MSGITVGERVCLKLGIVAAVLAVAAATAEANDCEDDPGYSGLDQAVIAIPGTPPFPAAPWPPIASCNHAPGGGGAGNLRCYGRVVYGIGAFESALNYRVDEAAGVDTVRVEVWDRETFSDELLWSGYTSPDGCFDTGAFPKGDDDEPDVYLRVVFDNDAVRVDSWCREDEFEFTWAFKSDQDWSPLFFEDFTGDEIDFGPVTMYRSGTFGAQWTFDEPAAFVAITRAERWLRAQSGLALDLPKVIVRDPRYLVSYYNGQIVHLVRGSLLHEYAHFLLDSIGAVALGECDPEYTSQCPIWCAESSSALAWQRGFADWFAVTAVREMSNFYTWDSGEPWIAERLDEIDDVEAVQVCPDTGVFPNDLELVPGMFTAFLHDLTDGQGDEFPWAQDDEKALNADNFSDCSRSSWFDIMSVVLASTPPMTPRQFVAAYAALYPSQRPALYWTAYNIDPDYLLDASFPDGQAPGVVPAAGSRAVGSSPCVPLTVDPPADDGTGACGYSWEWTLDPSGVEPDYTLDVNGSCALPGPVLAPGDWYVSLRAIDCIGNWSSAYATFGPFEIRDCNADGIVDACEVGCDESVLRELYDCDIPLDLCDGVDCGGNDCNGNLSPDDCDIASGISTDCNLDDVPDDCQTDTVQQWVGDGDGQHWSDPNNWSLVDFGSGNFAPRVPDENTDVCIPADANIIVTGTAAQAARMLCYGSIIVQSAGTSATLQIAAGSFVEGSLTIDGQAARATVDALDVGTLNLANGGVIRGDVTVQDAMSVAGDVGLCALGANATLTLFGTAAATAPLHFEQGGETLRIEAGGRYEFSGDGPIFWNPFGLVENFGVIERVAGNDVATVQPPCTNHGQIVCTTGALKFAGLLTNFGQITTPPGATLEIGGGAEFDPASVISASTLIVDNQTSSAAALIRGDVTITDGLVVGDDEVRFTPEANVISYGDTVTVNKGPLVIEPVTGNELVFDDVRVLGNGFVSAILRVETTDPLRSKRLELRGVVYDADLLTLEDPNDPTAVVLEWYVGADIVNVNLVTNGRTQFLGSGGSETSLALSTWTNNAVIELDRSFVMNGDSTRLLNGPTGVIDIMTTGANAIVDQTSPPAITTDFIENDGVIIKSVTGGDTTIGPNTWNRGDIIAENGNLQFGRYLRQTDGRTLVRGGSIAMVLPTRVFALEGGTLAGTNAFVGQVSNTGGAVEPGEGVPGTLTIDGNYTQSAAGALRIQIGGTNPGVDHDQLIVTGQTDIHGGTLVIELVNNYLPAIGSQYVIAQTGTFGQVTFDDVVGDGAFDVDIVGNTIVLTATLPANLADLADFDDSGIVDAPDAAFLSGCMNGPQQPLVPPCDQADLDGDGDVDLVDQYLMQLVFGT